MAWVKLFIESHSVEISTFLFNIEIFSQDLKFAFMSFQA